MTQGTGLLGRRSLLRLLGIGSVGVGAMAIAPPASADPPVPSYRNPPMPTADEALQRLINGNQRFIRHRQRHPDQSLMRLTELAQSQHPFAAVLGCADSRVPAELVFDQGLGDIFDIRIAGNIVTPESLGSLEYAVVHLNTPLVMVLGHERCGAVTAAVSGGQLEGSISTFVSPILPAVERVKALSGDAVNNTVTANVQYQVERVKALSPLISDRLNSGAVKLVGARYDLDTGSVTLVA